MKRIFLAFAVLFAIACAPVVSYGSDDGATAKIESQWSDYFSGEPGMELVTEITSYQPGPVPFDGISEIPVCLGEITLRLPREDNHMQNKIIKQTREQANLHRSTNLTGEFIGNYKFCIC